MYLDFNCSSSVIIREEHQKEEMKRARDTLHEMEKKLEDKEKELETKKQEYVVLEFQLKQSEARKNALENELKESAARYSHNFYKHYCIAFCIVL